MHIETVGDIDICFDRRGVGQPLVFISGTGSDLRNTPSVFDGPLVNHFDLLAYDQRGLGRTSKPDQAYSMADYADDAAHLMDHLGWTDALVAGISFGGMVAQELVLRHPGKVRRLVLACTSPGGDGGSSFPFHDIDHLAGEARGRHLIPHMDTRFDDAWAKANPAIYESILDVYRRDPFADEPGHAMGARRQLEARRDHNTWDRINQITCPVLIAAGRYDGVALPAAQHKMAGRIADADLRFFEGGHMFMLQDRTALPAIIEFLQA